MNILLISFLAYFCLLVFFFFILIVQERKNNSGFENFEDEEQVEWIRNWNEKKNNKRRKRI